MTHTQIIVLIPSIDKIHTCSPKKVQFPVVYFAAETSQICALVAQGTA